MIYYLVKNSKQCDDGIHDEMLSVDDYSMRVLTAKRGMKEFGLSREVAESIYGVKLDDGVF